MKIYYLQPAYVHLTQAQIRACHKRLKEAFPEVSDDIEEMVEEDILVQAEALGFIKLPDGWKT
jgi:hypothetical protein